MKKNLLYKLMIVVVLVVSFEVIAVESYEQRDSNSQYGIPVKMSESDHQIPFRLETDNAFRYLIRVADSAPEHIYSLLYILNGMHEGWELTKPMIMTVSTEVTSAHARSALTNISDIGSPDSGKSLKAALREASYRGADIEDIVLVEVHFMENGTDGPELKLLTLKHGPVCGVDEEHGHQSNSQHVRNVTRIDLNATNPTGGAENRAFRIVDVYPD